MEDPEFTDFWQLLGYHDAITPEIQRAALAAEVFWPCEIYYHAPADVRDGLIQAVSYTHLKEKGSVLQKLKQELPAHKPAAPKKQGPER